MGKYLKEWFNNESFFVSINQAEVISDFEEILKNAKGINSNVDVTNEKPDYDILVRSKNGETNGLHLILGNQGEESLVMYIGHEQYGFSTTAEHTNKLKKIISVQ
ncbi:hypothetical protein LGQ02_09285 [Bacillus shivajii]|uniref:hypothetical protein n=1 Tax=Bacillus shivajii TaxID=1983719 RepID=UPI001CFA1C9D|nr:hypothetical protein [Bacillus shivajii]UCZ54914.1 hypothetical protein LGQ02_09285 [Bacillus shivajii]